jgi:predicted pyridoxine 5'-phosphate oxidase superfamily flavin-nucleotide-binding protein
MNDSVFHEGERLIQERTGEREIALLNGRMIADRIPNAARSFIAQQRLCVCAGISRDGDLWAHFLTGVPGFAAASEDMKVVDLQLADEHGVLNSTPLFADLRVAVHEAFPNCPKYIQRRQLAEVSQQPRITAIEQGAALNDATALWIRNADTLFVASSHPDGRVDASHRGGSPGFVRSSGDVLLIPDYVGNSMYNTLGNFAVHPRAGLTFVDFDHGRQLQLTGDVELRFDVEAELQLTGGTGRWWAFRPRRWIASSWNQPLAWKYVDASRFNP